MQMAARIYEINLRRDPENYSSSLDFHLKRTLITAIRSVAFAGIGGALGMTHGAARFVKDYKLTDRNETAEHFLVDQQFELTYEKSGLKTHHALELIPHLSPEQIAEVPELIPSEVSVEVSGFLHDMNDFSEKMTKSLNKAIEAQKIQDREKLNLQRVFAENQAYSNFLFQYAILQACDAKSVR